VRDIHADQIIEITDIAVGYRELDRKTIPSMR
jgi:hypothetical protein